MWILGTLCLVWLALGWAALAGRAAGWIAQARFDDSPVSSGKLFCRVNTQRLRQHASRVVILPDEGHPALPRIA